MERRTTWAIIRRIGGFSLIVSFLNTLDRVNVGFAALTMNEELGFDPKIFGLGVGIFFVTYILGSVPMTSLSQRFGAERALPAMLVLWGLAAALMGSIHDVTSFYSLRLLLGVAEAGASPMILYLQSQWVPQKSQGRYLMVSSFALPASFIFGAPLSGWLMTRFHEVGSISGWRWMFVIEGAMTLLFGIIAWFWLPKGPQHARWLDRSQKQWLVSALYADSRKEFHENEAVTGWQNFSTAVRESRMWIFAACYFCSTVAFYVLLFWLPQVVRDLFSTRDTMLITLISVLPWIGAMFGILGVSWHSDRKQERYLHVHVSALVGALGMLGFGLLTKTPILALAALTIAGAGIGAAQIVMWTIPIGEFRGKAHAAVVFAFITLVGNMAGLIGAPLIGWLRKASDSFISSLFMVAAILTIEACILFALHRHAVHGKVNKAANSTGPSSVDAEIF